VTSEALAKEDSVIEVLQEGVTVNEKGSGEKLKELTVFNTLTQATPRHLFYGGNLMKALQSWLSTRYDRYFINLKYICFHFSSCHLYSFYNNNSY
jgi:hypothetical protein